jgi:vitamin B12 transporter
MRKFFAVTALFIGSQLSAQDSSSVLDNVVLTATRAPLKQSQTGKIVTIIDQATIQNNIGRSLGELLNTQAGFFINGANNSPGTNQDIYFRGAATGNMLVVVDGTPVYDPSQINNSFDINSIPLAQVEKIEILKGGQSTLWGSDAVAGVIQVFLKKPEHKNITLNTGLSYGSYHTMHANAALSGIIRDLGYSLQYNRQQSGGFSSAYDSMQKNTFDKDAFSQDNMRVALQYRPGKKISLSTFADLNTYHNDLDAGAYTDDKDYKATNKNKLAGMDVKFGTGSFTGHLTGSYQKSTRSYLNDSMDITSPYSSYSRGSYEGQTTTLESFGNGSISRHLTIVGGVQYIRQSSQQSYESIGSFGPYKSALGKDSAHTSQLSAYASLLFTNLGNFNLELGSRINHHSIYGSKATYTFNPSFIVDHNTKLFINISSAYKIPSLYHLFSEYGNKNLKPESSITWELGLQSQSTDQSIQLRLAAFKRDIKNIIIFYTDPATYDSKYFNRDAQHDYGLEIESTIKMGSIGTWTNSMAFVEGQGKQDQLKVDNLYRRPKFTFNSSLTLHPAHNLTLIPSCRYIGSRLLAPYDAGKDARSPYYTIDVYTAYDLKKIRLFASLHNITNQQYFDVAGYNSKQFNMMAGISATF